MKSIPYRALSAIAADVDHASARAGQAGELVRACRTDQGLTQADLSERLGVSQALLSGLESGARTWTPGMLRRVVAALDQPETEVAP